MNNDFKKSSYILTILFFLIGIAALVCVSAAKYFQFDELVVTVAQVVSLAAFFVMFNNCVYAKSKYNTACPAYGLPITSSPTAARKQSGGLPTRSGSRKCRASARLPSMTERERWKQRCSRDATREDSRRVKCLPQDSKRRTRRPLRPFRRSSRFPCNACRCPFRRPPRIPRLIPRRIPRRPNSVSPNHREPLRPSARRTCDQMKRCCTTSTASRS